MELKRTQLMFWTLDRRSGATAHRWRRDVEADIDALRRFVDS